MAAQPLSVSGDLPPQQKNTAYKHGHNANARPENESSHSANALSNQHSDSADFDNGESSVQTLDGQDTKDVEKGANADLVKDEGKAEAPDVNLVDWDGPNDPLNPQNWHDLKKWSNIAVLSAITLLVPLASSMFAPGVPQVLTDFNTQNQSLATFVVSVFLLGFATGPLILAPLSELYGRVIIYHVGQVGFIIFTIACAVSTNMNMLIGFRFMAGLIGAAPLAIGAGTIADCMPPQKRALAISMWSLGILLGPIIGPVAGGFLSQAEGWRWIFWVIAIATGVVEIMALVILRETHPPTILRRKTQRLQRETGNMNLHSKLASPLSPKDLFILSIARPFKLLVLSPICFLVSLYYAFVYAILYLLFTTYTFVFEEIYGFNAGNVGLVYLGIGIGLMIGLYILGATSDKIFTGFAKKYNGGTAKPEYRLPLIILAGPFIPAGLFIYGWTAQNHVQWAVPLLGTLLVGVGITVIFTSINTYLIDVFTIYAASALAANAVLRSILGAVFPLFGLQMYDALGLGWGNSLLAFIAIAMIPIPMLFYYYGERIRTHPKFQIKL